MTTELVKAEAVPLIAPPVPIHGGGAMAQAISAYRHLQHDLDKAMPEQIIQITGRPFRRKGYWRAVRAAFQLSVVCIKEERIVLDEDHGWLVTYRATAPNGVQADGDGCCMASEKSRQMASEHNCRSHGHTRAANRAISNLVGFGEVSAEEVEDDERPTRRTAPAPKPTPPAQRTDDDNKVGSQLITEAQAKRLFAVSKEHGWDRAQVQSLLGRCGYTRSAEITRADYDQIILTLEAGPAAPLDESPF